MRQIKVLLADGFPVIRLGMRSVLGSDPWLKVVGEAADGRQAADQVARLGPDVVILGDNLPDRAPGSTPMLDGPAARVGTIFFLARVDGRVLWSVLGHGARGVLLRDGPPDDLVRAVRVVAAGGTFVPESIPPAAGGDSGDRPGAKPARPPLSRREAEVLRLIAVGFMGKQVAAKLNLSVKTVETYKLRAMEKLGLGRLSDLVRYAHRNGWYETGRLANGGTIVPARVGAVPPRRATGLLDLARS